MISDFFTKNDAVEAWKKFPEEIGPIFRVLWLELVRLNAKWNLNVQLYGDRQAISVLDDAPSAAFGLIQASLRNDIVLSLCRLTDPSLQGRNENLTLELLVDRVEKHDESVGRTLRPKLEGIRRLCGPIITMRNKNVAHADLETTLEPRLLPVTDRTETEDGLRLMIELMNDVERHFAGSWTPYRAAGANAGESLLAHLAAGLKHYRECEPNPLQRRRHPAESS